MCLLLYAGATTALPTVPWDEAARAFYVEAADTEAEARGLLGTPHVSELGSHLGCGCGYVSDDGNEDMSPVRRTRAALVAYLRNALDRGPVRLFAAWGGHAVREPVRADISLAELETDPFWEELWHQASVQNVAYLFDAKA